MIIGTGDHAGKSTQEMFLKLPDWVQFFVRKNPDSKISDEFRRHDKSLTAKPFTEKCNKCEGVATRLSFYAGNASLGIAWCDSCDPYSLAARQGKLTIIKTFRQALAFVDSTCKGRRSDKRTIVRRLAEAKGFPKRAGQSITIAFLP